MAHDFEIGKIPPQVRELEEAVIGAVLIERNAILEVADILIPECFYVDAHEKIWRVVTALNSAMKPIDTLTVVEALKKKGELESIGGEYAITQVCGKISSSANIVEHARIIYEKYILRQLIKQSTEIIIQAYEPATDAFELLGKAQTSADQINNSITTGESFYDSVINRAHKLSEASKNFTKTGVMTYLWKFDNHAGGFQDGELIIVAGRPAMGKSAVMCDFGYQQAKNGIPVGIFSLEMSREQLIDRFNSMETEVEYEKMRTGTLTADELKSVGLNSLNVAELPFQINDEGGIGISKLSSISKMWKHKYGIKILYVDYIQLIGAHDSGIKFGNREQEISYISRKLKTLAKNLGIPIVALSQLSRSVESRESKRPQLSDLRESGAIEQDADMVIYPFRPSYYKLNDPETGQPYSDDYCELIIAKFRNGKTKDLKNNFLPQYSKFVREQSPVYGNYKSLKELDEECPI